VRKSRWINVKVSQRIAEMVKALASTMGVSTSEFVRQALLEKLERMSVISSELKAVSAHRLPSMGETEGSTRLGRDSEGGVTSLKTPKDKVYFAGAEAFSRDHRRCLNEC